MGQGQEGAIDLTRTGDNKTADRLHQLELEDVLLSGYSVSSGGDRPRNPVAELHQDHHNNLDSKDTNEDGSPDRVQYDLATGVGS